MQLTYSGGGREDRNGLYLFLGERIVRYHPGIFTFSKMSFFRYVSVFLNNFCYLPPLHFFLCWTKGLNFTAAFVETATVLLVSKTSATLIFLRRLSSFLVFRISHCQKKKKDNRSWLFLGSEEFVHVQSRYKPNLYTLHFGFFTVPSWNEKLV